MFEPEWFATNTDNRYGYYTIYMYFTIMVMAMATNWTDTELYKLIESWGKDGIHGKSVSP